MTAALRRWLNQQTRGLLEEQTGNLSLTADTVLALAAALYYKAPWQSAFETADTASDVFHAPDGDMRTPYMHQTFSHSSFYTGNGFSAMPIALETGSMWLILPDTGTSADSLLERGVVTDLLSSPASYRSKQGVKVKVSLPRFDASGDLDLRDGLKTMGVKNVFDSGVSDFSPLTEDAENLMVSRIQHAARVTIDEDGCEAAAYTVGVVELTAAMMEEPEIIDFTLNRPFLFVVAEGSLPLFAGVVNTPEAA